MVREENAKVASIDGGRAVLVMERSASCRRCGLCASAGAGEMKLEVNAVEGLRLGHKVVVKLDTGNWLLAMVMMFGLPLIGLVLGAVLGQAAPVLGSRNAASVLYGVILMAFAFVLAVTYDRKVSRHLPPPTIIRIEPDE